MAGEEVAFGGEGNPHNVAGLIKLYLRELSEPLMTYALYDAFIATQGWRGILDRIWSREFRRCLCFWLHVGEDMASYGHRPQWEEIVLMLFLKIWADGNEVLRGWYGAIVRLPCRKIFMVLCCHG